MKSRFFKAGWKFIDILFPPCCAGCGEWGERFCQTCFNNTKLIDSNICQQCGEPMDQSSGLVCKRCQSAEMYFTAVRSWAYFEDPIKKAIHKLKYKRNLGLGEVLADPLGTILADCKWKIDLITAVPLDKERLRERGYNQAVLLARPLAWKTNLSYNDNALKRIRTTRPQVGLTRDQRIKNMEEVFSAEPGIVKNRRVLVVDDVFTTGSTINACAKALLASGAYKVFGVTVARSPLL